VAELTATTVDADGGTVPRATSVAVEIGTAEAEDTGAIGVDASGVGD
jgi:hypothetical protein